MTGCAMSVPRFGTWRLFVRGSRVWNDGAGRERGGSGGRAEEGGGGEEGERDGSRKGPR